MQLFYTPDIHTEQTQYFLSEEESKHCIKVLRLEPGNEVQLIDGKGGFYTAIVKEANQKKTLLNIISVINAFNKRNHFLHIALAPTKNLDRMEWFVEKATELGIDEISFIICRRSERREIKTDRLNKITDSAIKQSVKAYRPVLNEAVTFSNFLLKQYQGQKFIAHCEKTDKITLRTGLIKHDNYVVMIGPEGDFTPEEIMLALQAGYKPLTLGDSRLRTETAALEACFEINFLNR